MAETQSRSSATRGRGSGRAGRGGHSGSARVSRHAAAPRAPSDELPTALPMVSLEEQGEIGQLKKKNAEELTTLKDMFPDYNDDELVLVLQETDGDLVRTIERISAGSVSQFSDVKKKTREKAKLKPEGTPASSRGRGRGGYESVRGGRGRVHDRGGRGRGGRGSSVSAANGNAAPTSSISLPTADANGWGEEPKSTTTDVTNGVTEPIATDSWGQPATSTMSTVPVSEAEAPNAEAEQDLPKSSIIPQGSKKSWASMLAKPKASPAPSKAIATASSPLIEQNMAKHPGPTEEGPTATDTPVELDGHPIVSDAEPSVPDVGAVESAATPPATAMSGHDSGAELTPPRNQLTEDNVENLPDASLPAATDTVASTRDASSTVGTGTHFAPHTGPLPSRPPMGGYATTAWKATGVPGRSISYQKRMMEQREAVVMPSNHAVDRATVQFGSMGLNGDNKPLDVDDDREEAQTRAPAAQSPPSQPRTSLPPPTQQQSAVPDAPVYETGASPKHAPGLPIPSQSPSAHGSGAQNVQQGPQSNQSYNQYGRYGVGPIGQEHAAPPTKPYDPFGQQLNYPPSSDAQSGFTTTSQASHIHQNQHQSNSYNDYNSQYGSDGQRNAYGAYYGSSYPQQGTVVQQEQSSGPQRTGSALASTESHYGSAQQVAVPGRFSDNQASGHTTPNPAMASQQQGGAQPQQVHHGQSHAQSQTGHSSGYGYQQTPYYGGSYYGGSYMNQYPNNYYNQQGYGGPYGGKANMYGQPQQTYGMSPQTSYEHAASPANASAFANNNRGADSGLQSGLGDYARSGSTQPSQQNVAGSGTYGGHVTDPYGRGSYNGQGQYGQHNAEDALKPYGDSKTGPSPSLGQPGRTGSAANATNSGYGNNQSNYAPPQSQQGYGGYQNHHPMHTNHSSGYGNTGGASSHHVGGQGHQSGAYGGGYAGYGSSNHNNYSYGRGGASGWGGNYGH